MIFHHKRGFYDKKHYFTIAYSNSPVREICGVFGLNSIYIEKTKSMNIVEGYKSKHGIDLLSAEVTATINSTPIAGSNATQIINSILIALKALKYPLNYGITKESAKSLLAHAYDGPLSFLAMMTIPEILKARLISSGYGDSHSTENGDNTGTMLAPIDIQGQRYFAVLVNAIKPNGFQYPYAIRVFSETDVKNLLKNERNSPQGNDSSRPNSDFKRFCANVLIKYITNNCSAEDIAAYINETPLNTSSLNNNTVPATQWNHGADDVISEKIKITESQLRRVIRESLIRTLYS